MTRESHESGLIAVGSLLERGVDLDTILAAIVDEVVQRLGADRGTLYLLDRDRNQIFSKAAHLPELEEIRLDLGQGVAGSVAVSGKLTNLPEPYADGRFEKQVDKETGYTTDSMLVTPIRDARGGIIGVLLRHTWPGNIRELENCVESAVVLSDDELISKRHLSLPSGEPTNPTIVTASDLSRTLEQVERDYILAVLDDCGGNQSEAARRLGISRNTLGRKLKSYG